MRDGWLNWAATLLKCLGATVLAGGCGEQSTPTSTTIAEIEPGEGAKWGTLSGLTAHPANPNRLYAVTDTDSPPLRIIEIDISTAAPKAVAQITVTAPGFDRLDCEGIVAKPDGGFWLASEGGEGNSPPNVLLEVDASGRLMRFIQLPAPIASRVAKKGFEGVALDRSQNASKLYVAFQAPLAGDPPDQARIAAFDLATHAWSFYAYPLERTEKGDLTGLSELVHISGSRFAALERDGSGGKHALKKITTFDLGAQTGASETQTPPVLQKSVAVDLVAVFKSAGRKTEKEIEGLTIAANGQVYALTDNDNERPTLLLRLGSGAELLGAS